MGRVPLIREVVHPEMPWMRAVFGGVVGLLSGAGIAEPVVIVRIVLPNSRRNLTTLKNRDFYLQQILNLLN